MNKRNLQSHLSYHHDRFPIKKGDELKTPAIHQTLVNLKEAIFDNNNISHLTIRSKSFQDVYGPPNRSNDEANDGSNEEFNGGSNGSSDSTTTKSLLKVLKLNKTRPYHCDHFVLSF